MKENNYWFKWGIAWFLVNISIASMFHLAFNVPYRTLASTYLALAFLIIGLVMDRLENLWKK